MVCNFVAFNDGECETFHCKLSAASSCTIVPLYKNFNRGEILGFIFMAGVWDSTAMGDLPRILTVGATLSAIDALRLGPRS